MHLYPILITVQLLVTLINCIYGFRLFRNKETNSNELKFIYSFCLIDFLTGVLIFWYNLSPLEIPYFTFFELTFIYAEILLLPTYISKILNVRHNFIIPLVLCVFPSITSFFLFKNPSIISQAISGIYITYYCFKYFKFLFTTNRIFSIGNSKHFWIILGIMICYTGSIPSSVNMMILETIGTSNIEHSIANVMVNLYLMLNITMHSLFNKAFACNQEQQSSYSFQ